MHALQLSLVHKERVGAVKHFTAALQLRPCNTECCLQTKHNWNQSINYTI